MQAAKLLLTFVAMLAPARLVADGGTIQLRKEAGALLITVFASPSPLSAGPADISVLLQKRNGLDPVLDADVAMRLRTDAPNTEIPEIHARPTRQQAQNKLLYAAPVTFSESGKWRLAVTIFHDGVRTNATGTIDVAPAPEKALSYWSYIAFPPLTIALFVVRERLISRKARE